MRARQLSSSTPLVTVVTAAFNAVEGLKKTVESVASQTCRSFEHIVIDGGSVDGTREYLDSLGDAVRWISEPDQGIAEALNKGVRMARGEYVLVLQAEDHFVDDESLARAAVHLGGTRDIVSFDVMVVEARERRIVRARAYDWRTELFSTVPHQGAFCRRELFDRIGAFDPSLRIGMDYDFMLRAKRRGATIEVVPLVISVMPYTGVSSRTDPGSLRARLAENRRIQRRYLNGPLGRAVHALFWVLYPRFKLLKHRLADRAAR